MSIKISFFIGRILTTINLFVDLYLICKHSKLKTLITGLALYQLYPKIQIVKTLTPKRINIMILFAHVNENGGQ